jgi:hypothetical protein
MDAFFPASVLVDALRCSLVDFGAVVVSALLPPGVASVFSSLSFASEGAASEVVLCGS